MSTVIKPSQNTSCLVSSSSELEPFHIKKYFKGRKQFFSLYSSLYCGIFHPLQFTAFFIPAGLKISSATLAIQKHCTAGSTTNCPIFFNSCLLCQEEQNDLQPRCPCISLLHVVFCPCLRLSQTNKSQIRAVPNQWCCLLQEELHSPAVTLGKNVGRKYSLWGEKHGDVKVEKSSGMKRIHSSRATWETPG